jgi:hypothetical protein
MRSLAQLVHLDHFWRTIHEPAENNNLHPNPRYPVSRSIQVRGQGLCSWKLIHVSQLHHRCQKWGCVYLCRGAVLQQLIHVNQVNQERHVTDVDSKLIICNGM